MIKVLVVEDEPGIQTVLKDTFKSVGYLTFAASSAKEAMEIFLKEKPDAIFLDILLPDKDGFTLLKEMKAVESNNIVIMVSSESNEENQKKAKKLGAVDFITKPFFRETLRQSLAHNIGRLPKTTTKDKPKILIVDDEEDICVSLNRYFQKRIVADIVITFDGDQAFSLLSKNKFDVAFMDIKLPGMNGLTIVEKIKQKSPETAFLVITGYLASDLLQKASKLGVTEYFHKPMRPEEIYKKLVTILIAKNKYIPKQ